MPELLELRGVTKQFPGVRALSGVDFTVRAGEVHALMGENGAGKSTLIKVLTGVHRPDAGEITFDGRRIQPRSPRDAQALGISTVYQEVNLIPHLSVAENIILGREPMRWGRIDWRRARERANAAMARLGIRVDVSQSLSSYSIAIQQMIAIARALDISAKLLILDEPTSSLDAGEVQTLFSVMRRLKEDGLGIVFVTHFIDQVYQVADRITVLRNGELVGEFEAKELSRISLVARMLGRDPAEVEAMSAQRERRAVAAEEPFMRVRGLGRRGALSPIDLEVREGEVLGLAGLLGSGRTETARLLFGADRADQGQVTIDGKPVSLSSPRRAIAYGIGFCPEDRKSEGIIPDLSVRENIILALQARRGALRCLSRQRQAELANHYIRALRIATPDAEKRISELSGGTQQKAIVARWLAANPRLLILDEPTRGIDVGTKAEIEKLVLSLCAEGRAVLFISSELEEVVRASNRVAVLRDRRKVAELSGADLDEAAVMRAIATSTPSQEGADG